MRYYLLETQPKRVHKAAEDELAAAGAMYFERDVDVVEIAEMKSLRGGGGRSAMHPLDGTIHRASRRTPKTNRSG